jgi:hypothetical protein
VNLFNKTLINLNKYLSKYTKFRLFKAPNSADLELTLCRLQPRHLPKNLSLIRLGGYDDGGYVMPDCLEGVFQCLSPGVGPSVSFESDLYNKYGIKSHLIDASVKKIESEYILSYTDKFLSSDTYDEYISFNDWCSKLQVSSTKDYILQMDIEGGEFESILSLSEKYLNSFKIIAIELHFLDHIASKAFFSIFNAFLSKLLRYHYVIHLHPNTNSGMDYVDGMKIDKTIEVTLLHKKLYEDIPRHKGINFYPISNLDSSNVPNIADRQLSPSYFCEEKE